jgi:agmatinase
MGHFTNLIETLSVEVAPVYDNVGETTVLAAAEIVLSLIGLMVKAPM